MLRVLVIGEGGREHALCWRLRADGATVFCVRGNPKTASVATPLAIATTSEAVLAAVKAHDLHLVVIGPEQPLVDGLADSLRNAGVAVMGPNQAAAQLEGSKAFSRAVMAAAGIPHARGVATSSLDEARTAIAQLFQAGVVIKADGLAAGKGVVVADSAEQAEAACQQFLEARIHGDAGARIVVEERLVGEEVSFFAVCAGEEYVALGVARDHKRLLDGDKGPNTGGMGAFSPVPGYEEDFEQAISDAVVAPLLREMARRGTPFSGVLFVGLMVDPADHARFRVLEFNVRFGDPECQVLMRRLADGDLLRIVQWCARPADFARPSVRLHDTVAMIVVLAAKTYPASGGSGEEVPAVLVGAEETLPKAVRVFHAGTAWGTGEHAGRIVAKGGRVLGITAIGETRSSAAGRIYGLLSKISDTEFAKAFQYRKDIGINSIIHKTGLTWPSVNKSPTRYSAQLAYWWACDDGTTLCDNEGTIRPKRRFGDATNGFFTYGM